MLRTPPPPGAIAQDTLDLFINDSDSMFGWLQAAAACTCSQTTIALNYVQPINLFMDSCEKSVSAKFSMEPYSSGYSTIETFPSHFSVST